MVLIEVLLEDKVTLEGFLRHDLLDLWVWGRIDLGEAILDDSACSWSVAHAAVFTFLARL